MQIQYKHVSCQHNVIPDQAKCFIKVDEDFVEISDNTYGNIRDNIPQRIINHDGDYFELEYVDKVKPSFYPIQFMRMRFPKLILEYYKNNSVLFLK
ncbi:hypothetical protein pb186bvf_018496 [Paramecium bursaria]